MRHHYFSQLLYNDAANSIATGHTLDDQAETVLMRLARGAGTRGLAGIYPKKLVSDTPIPGSLIRPLLAIHRAEIETYLKELGQPWREDSSNRDPRHSRNRVRHEALPCLERTLNPSIRETLANTSEVARDEEQYWMETVQRQLQTVWRAEISSGTLDLNVLRALPIALQRRIVRAAAETLALHLDFKHVEEILAVAHGPAHSAALPSGWTIARAQQSLSFSSQSSNSTSSDYDYVVPIPGGVVIPALGVRLEVLTNTALDGGYNSGNNSLGTKCEFKVRNWRAGDRFWPGHTKAPKKVKELLQELRVTGTKRQLWPVITLGEEIVWMRGFTLHSRSRPDLNGRLTVREVPNPGEQCEQETP